MLGFVDDKRHYINLILQQLKEPLEEAMIKSVNIWNELLTFVGGKLFYSGNSIKMKTLTFRKIHQ